MHIKVGTRGSKLALAQTQTVIDTLQEKYKEHTFEAVVIKTTGDKEQIKALDAIGTKGIFTDEIEKALLAGEIQMAVHSMKDMPDTPAKGLSFAKAWKREDPRDVLILREKKSLEELPKGAVIATGSKRRAFQIKNQRPDIEIVGIRGNVDTRIRKLSEPMEDGRYIDGIVLAAAGIKRIGRAAEITQYLEVEQMIPAPAQGILALEIKTDNKMMETMLNQLSDEESELAAKAERGFLKAIGGDCHLPVGAYLKKNEKDYSLYTLFGNEDGSNLTTACVSGSDIEEMIRKSVKKHG